jgi:hypothetical protein
MTRIKKILEPKKIVILDDFFKKLLNKTIKKEHYINVQQYIAYNKYKIYNKENKN